MICPARLARYQQEAAVWLKTNDPETPLGRAGAVIVGLVAEARELQRFFQQEPTNG